MSTELLKVLKLATELCDSVDAAEEDIGGHRSPTAILGELGPAVDAANKLAKEADTSAVALKAAIDTGLLYAKDAARYRSMRHHLLLVDLNGAKPTQADFDRFDAAADAALVPAGAV
jgi:hypothetical protein